MRSPADRHLGCFQIWAIMNDVAKNIYIQVFAQMFSLLLDRILGTELLDRMVALCLTFKETDKMFSKELYILTLPPTNSTMYEGSNFFTFLPVLGIDCLLITNILLDIITLWFNLYFPTKK